MSSQERHRNKKNFVFKGGNFILSPLNSKNISLNFINTNKKDNKSKNNSNIIINNLSFKKSKKNLNQEFVRSNPNLLAFSRGNNSFLSAMKNNNSSSKNFINLTNNNIKKLYVNKKPRENTYFINSSKSHNKNNNLGQKKLSFEYIKTDIPLSNTNTSILKKNTKIQNIPSINLIYPQKNNFQKSNTHFYDDLLGSPSGLFKKDLPNFKYNSSEKILEEHISLRKGKDKQERSESGTNQSTNESKNIKKKKVNINNDVFIIGEKIVRKSPEEIHWYFVKSIQDGKKLQAKI